MLSILGSHICPETEVAVRAGILTKAAESVRRDFTRAFSMDKVTDIASWQAVVSQGWPIYSVFCEHERCRFSPRSAPVPN